jgi:hypothetical protein
MKYKDETIKVYLLNYLVSHSVTKDTVSTPQHKGWSMLILLHNELNSTWQEAAAANLRVPYRHFHVDIVESHKEFSQDIGVSPDIWTGYLPN